MKCGLIGAAAILVLLAISLEHVHADYPYAITDGCRDEYFWDVAKTLCYKYSNTTPEDSGPGVANYADAVIACDNEGAVLPTTYGKYGGYIGDTWLITSDPDTGPCRLQTGRYGYDEGPCGIPMCFLCIIVDTPNADLCEADPCENGGTCTPVGDSFACACQGYYKGPTCEELDTCDLDPCENGGVCQSDGDLFTCDCLGFYSGPTCGQAMYMNARICDDPLVTSFDRAVIAIPFPGTYLLISFPGKGEFAICGFTLAVDVQQVGTDVQATSVTLDYGGHIYFFAQSVIVVDGATGVPITNPNDGETVFSLFGVSITWDGDCLVFECEICDFRLRWCPAGAKSCAFLSIEKSYLVDEATNSSIENLSGIFGNGNGDEDDDYTTSGGEYVGDQADRNGLISNSWLL